MSKRPIVSYDDIVPTNSPHAGPSATPQQQERSSAGPYPKKRKRSNPRNSRQYGRGAEPQRHIQHWDDPGSAVQPMPYDDEAFVSMTTQVILEPGEEQEEANEEEEGEESRELTHDEIWDDSALIEAWESAAAEYEAFHGTDQSWKNEPVKKSPLWYNIPPPPSKIKKSPQKPETNVAPRLDADDSQPINFEGFVPHHDPSLTSSSAIIPCAPSVIDGHQLATAPEGPVSQDEAFNRALGAMYWAGYWTAVYHGHKKQPGTSAPSNEGEEEDRDQESGEADDVDDATVEEELISTQR